MELLIDDHVKFSNEHNKLLTAQVLITDAQTRTEKHVQELAQALKHTDERLTELTERLNELTEGINELKERINELTERLNALITVVDGLIRKPPAN
jgi:ABC-type transporter Mla subunit MlaD